MQLHVILKILMLRWNRVKKLRSEGGDTLVEVSISLAILSFVLMSSTALTTEAFREGQIASERIEVANVAQEQMEALRSFRDNSSWAVFEGDINPVANGFHMALQTGSATQWVPVAGAMTTSTSGSPLTVPTSTMSIATTTSPALQDCGYDFTLKYSFDVPGGSSTDEATNTIETRLANLKFSYSGVGPAPCP